MDHYTLDSTLHIFKLRSEFVTYKFYIYTSTNFKRFAL